MLREHRVVVLGVALEQRQVLGPAHVAERDQGVAFQPARLVARDVQPLVVIDDRASVGFEPGDEVDVAVCRGVVVAPSLLDAAVPRADVLADVASVDLCAERGTVALGDRCRRLRPVREALRSVERSGLVEIGRASCRERV